MSASREPRGGKSIEQRRVTDPGFAKITMTGRVGELEDIVNAVTLFASPDSGWIAAQVLAVDGGRMDCIAHG